MWHSKGAKQINSDARKATSALQKQPNITILRMLPKLCRF